MRIDYNFNLMVEIAHTTVFFSFDVFNNIKIETKNGIK